MLNCGLILHVLTFKMFFIGFFGSVVTKKFGHRPVAVVSSVLGSLCMSMGAFAEELWQLCLMSGVFSGRTTLLIDIPISLSRHLM